MVLSKAVKSLCGTERIEERGIDTVNISKSDRSVCWIDKGWRLPQSPVPGVKNTTQRGELLLKKFAGSRFGAERASGTPSQLISRRPWEACRLFHCWFRNRQNSGRRLPRSGYPLAWPRRLRTPADQLKQSLAGKRVLSQRLPAAAKRLIELLTQLCGLHRFFLF